MKYTPSAFTGQMSGSLGSTVASHNRSGSYFRARTIPTNPNTIRQQAVRAAFGTAVQRWTSTLTAAQRALWNDYAGNTPIYDALGNPIFLTGQNMYVRTNVVRLQLTGFMIDAAPTTYNTGEPVTRIDTGVDGTPNSLGVNNAEDGYDVDYMIAGGASAAGQIALYIGATLNATRNFYKGPYQLVGTVATTATDTSEAYTALFSAAKNANGDPLDGQNRGVKALISYDDGRLSQAYEAILPVVVASI